MMRVLPAVLEIQDGPPNQLFCAPAHLYFPGVAGRLVYLSVECSCPIIRRGVWNHPGIGAARHKLGSLVTKFYSPDPRNNCATCGRSAVPGGGRHYSF